MLFNVGRDRFLFFKNILIIDPGSSTTPSLSPSPANDNRNVFSSMAMTQPTGKLRCIVPSIHSFLFLIEMAPPSTSRNIVPGSFNYTNDHNSQVGRAGMNTNFPGASETLDRFIKPHGPSYSPSLAVAQPDFSAIGRPMARLVSQSSCSEYVDRFSFPDGAKIERYPWLRP